MRLYLAAYETQDRSYSLTFPLDYNLFVSYFYANKASYSLRRLAGVQRGLVTVDSGAHSFFGYAEGISATGHKSDGEMPDPHRYLRRYLEWLNRHRTLFDYFVELDIQEIVGQRVVDAWRKQITRLGLGERMIPVHHSCNTWDDWCRLVDTTPSRYVGVEGLRRERKRLPYNKMIRYAYERGVRVHGFAFTRMGLLAKYPFYSVDSSSWTVGLRYGKTPVWTGRGMKMLDPRQDLFFQHRVPLKLHNTQRSDVACQEKLHWAARQYAAAQTFYTRLWRERGIDWSQHEPQRQAA